MVIWLDWFVEGLVMTKLEELVNGLVSDELPRKMGLKDFRAYIADRFGPLVEISKIVGSEKIYPFSPAKVREAVARAEEE